MWELPIEDTAEQCVAAFEKHWEKQSRLHSPSIYEVLNAIHRPAFKRSARGILLQVIGILLVPLTFDLILDIIGAIESVSRFWGFFASLALFCAIAIQSLGSNYALFITTRIGNQIKASIIAAVSRKNVSIHAAASAHFKKEDVMKFQGTYAEQLSSTVPLLHMVWSAPLQILVSAGLLTWILGLTSMLAGLAMILIIVSFNELISKRYSNEHLALEHLRDKRVSNIDELLSNPLNIKASNFDKFFYAKTAQKRATEITQIHRTNLTRSAALISKFNYLVWILSAALLAFTVNGYTLTPRVAFPALLWFNILMVSVSNLISATRAIRKSKIVLESIQNYLLAEDKVDVTLEHPSHPDGTVVFHDASFKWNTTLSSSNTLHALNLRINPGELVAIVGNSGSGKTSFLTAILGELYFASGRMTVNGSVAYVQQEPWIQNASLRENIISGTNLNAVKYQQCIECCEITNDINLLPQGDETEIGEKGFFMSVDQKQRIAFARAMYQNASIYLLDDPLNAVDPFTAHTIFDTAVVGALRNKTRIYVTNHPYYLASADKVIILREGQIVAADTYQGLLSNGVSFEAFNAVNEMKVNRGAPNKPVKSCENEKAFSIVHHKREQTTDWTIYKRFMELCGIVSLICVLILFAICFACALTGDIFLAFWSARHTHEHAQYLYIYFAWTMGRTLFSVAAFFSIMSSTLHVSKQLHNTVLERICKAQLTFFYTCPTGHLHSIFSRDMMSIDERFPTYLLEFFLSAFLIGSVAFAIGFATPFILVPLLPLSYIFYSKQLTRYVRSSREIQQLDRLSKFPIYSLFSESLSGILTIRSANLSQVFIDNNDHHINENLRVLFVYNALRRWLAIRVEFLSNVITLFSAFLCVLERETIDPGIAGFAIVYSLQLPSILARMVETCANVETEQAALERVLETSESVATERASPPFDVVEWPKGEIDIRDLKMQYKDDGTFVLDGLSLKTSPGEKICIVGETGSGKTSLFLALLGITEVFEGSIFVDAVDISKIDLSVLRSKVAFIPKQPKLFDGSIRENLDPHYKYGDSPLWKALETVNMKNFVANYPKKLDTHVGEIRAKLRPALKQLLYLARALLCGARILLHESLVEESDNSIVLSTIQDKFPTATVLSVSTSVPQGGHWNRVLYLVNGRLMPEQPH
eukprot:Phypoly_transcript_00602.p1 GENE.Phypoly_transcript_00602~~Phypoly_transcript_00602.p1  ORF type:complete len:1161 (-),score=124.31 Phypoly_transcript_00602:13-3495(-)